MELYIPPPSAFLPRLPPPRPVVPAVPVVPIPDLPDTVHAPEGSYTLNPAIFPSIGSPAPPAPFERPPQMPSTSFIAGASGFMIAPPGPQSNLHTGQTAMSYGSSIVNGQHQPGFPVRMSWVNVYFAPKAGGDKSLGFLSMGGGGNAKGEKGEKEQMGPALGYEPSISSDSDSPTTSDNPPPLQAIEVPISALPQQGKGRMPFSKASTSVSAGLPRPKNNLRSSSSTFVTRLQALDNLPKIMGERGKNGGEMVRWGFWNLGRTFGWGEEGGRIKDPLARVTFSQVPTCHTVSPLTASPERLDILIGFASGDIIWLDFVVGRYTRINKGGLLNNTAVKAIHFDPRHPNWFLAAFADSTLLKFNLFADDPLNTSVTADPKPWVGYFEKNPHYGTHDEDSMRVWTNEEFGNLGELSKKGNKNEERSPWAGRNPMAAYKFGSKALNALAYAPDGQLLAAVSEDGMMRLCDTKNEQLIDTFAGYFGELNCVSWSPDSRFVAVGGQDDLITIFSPKESKVVARCQGHSAFVSSITFDYTRGGGYRFASVGEDGKLVLWDFTAAQLHRPRHHHSNASHHRIPGSSISLATGQPKEANGATSNGHSTGKGSIVRIHSAPPRSEVALLQPVMARMIEGCLISCVHFSPQAIYTVSRSAHVKIWQRPPRQSSSASRRQGQRSATKVQTPKSEAIALGA